MIQAVLIAGPTASGKSALALALAEELRAMIVNADSMQVYRDLRVITARPTAAEEARVPHRLFGHADAGASYSTGQWVREAKAVLEDLRASGRMPIFVGGTGLYFKALTRGLAAVPPIPDRIRTGIRAELEAQGAAALHARLSSRDPVAAARIRPGDGMRAARALEVYEATGRSIVDWHREGLPPLVESGRAVKVFLDIDRGELYRRIDARFDAMLKAGALEEARALAARGLDPRMPAMKAHGIPWLIKHLQGNLPLEEAAARAKQDTRHYAKRQMTWFRHQLPEFEWLAPEAAAERVLGHFAARKKSS